jgi:N-methylhydantoinase B
MASPDLDPVTLEVFHETLVSTVAEMRVTVLRTAFSSIIYEGQDFSCALTDAQGRLVALSREDTPLHVGPLNLQVPEAVKKFKGQLNPGDILLANDPFTSGTHLNDVLMMAPFFVDGRVLMISCIRAHWGDIGGMTPGSISGRSTEIFQEGVRIPIVKVYEQGQPNQAMIELLLANVRQPRDRRGDFFAQLATTRTAEERLTNIVRRFGADRVARGIEQVLTRTENRMRAQIATLPTDDFGFEDYMDSDGNDPDPVRIRVRVAVGDGDLRVDFTGSSSQRSGPVNASLAVASTSVFVTLKALLDPTGHINAGAFRPVSITAPPGTVVNAIYPAPMGGFTEVYRRVSGALIGALSRCAPSRIAGDTKGTANHVYIGFVDNRGVRSIFYEYPAGGTGGFLEHDGSNAVREWDTGDFNSIQSTELVEHEHPCIVERCELRCDSAGPGTHRGGLGMRRVIRVENALGLFSALSERNVFTPYGVAGGAAAKGNRFYVEREGEILEPSPIPGKATGFALQSGDRVVFLTAGGGGYGDPLQRDPSLVAEDVAAGLVSHDAAREQYGVVLRLDQSVDVDATDLFRLELKGRRQAFTVRTWTAEAAEVTQSFFLHPAARERLKICDGALVEVSNGQGAPIRGRLHTSADVPDGALALAPASLTMLGVAHGDNVRIEKIAPLSLY